MNALDAASITRLAYILIAAVARTAEGVDAGELLDAMMRTAVAEEAAS